MTRDEAIVAIVNITSLTPDDVNAFLACSDDERAELVAAYTTAGKVASPSAWKMILAILAECAALANLIIPIESAITGGLAIISSGQAIK